VAWAGQDSKAHELRRAEEVAILEAEKVRLGEVLSAGARRCAELEAQVQELDGRADEAQGEVDVMHSRMREKEAEITILAEALAAAQEEQARLESGWQGELGENLETKRRATRTIAQLKGTPIPPYLLPECA
jgi:predicted nuclease with TOPRIM domain